MFVTPKSILYIPLTFCSLFCCSSNKICGVFINLDNLASRRRLQYDGRFSCPACRETMCSMCTTGHGELTCEQYKSLAQEERNPEDAKFHSFAKKQGFARCKNCKHFVVKTDGCHLVSCRCGNYICYGCKNSLNECTCHTKR